MARSSEYPDLTWMEPRAWGRGRDGKAVRYIVIHYTAGSEHATSAEDGARYNQTRRDGTSAHYFVDRDSVVQGVLTKDRANCARHRGNRLGIQYELCGTAQTRAQWLDAASKATLRNAARQAARDAVKYGIPARRLSVDETRRAWTNFPLGPKGFVGHVDCTYAYPEDGGDHTDPGKDFPWDIFLSMVKEEVAAITEPKNEPKQEDDMPSEITLTQWSRNQIGGDWVKPENAKVDFNTFASLVVGFSAQGAKLLDREIVLPDGRKVNGWTILRWLSAAEEDTREQVEEDELESRRQILEALANVSTKLEEHASGPVPPPSA